MNSREAILNELKELNSSLLPDLGGTSMYVPEGYFSTLPERILARVNGANEELTVLSPLLAGISKQMPYSVPEGYFSQQEHRLDKTEFSLEAIPDRQRMNPYTVPAGYFEQLPERVMGKLATPKAKVVTMAPRRWMKMAVAAVLAGVIALSGYLYFEQKNAVTPVQSEAWVQKKLKGESDRDIEEFIKTTAPVQADNLAEAANSTTEVRHLLKDVSQKEIEAFLDEVPAEDVLN